MISLDVQQVRYNTVRDVLDVLPAGGKLVIATDKDGTTDFKVNDPKRAYVPLETVAQLLRLADQADSVKLLLVSGREVQWLERLAGPIAFHPEVVLYGSHGNEKKIGGNDRLEYSPSSKYNEPLSNAYANIRKLLSQAGLKLKQDSSEPSGLYLEVKNGSAGMVLHFRTAPELAERATPIFETGVQSFIDTDSHILEKGDGILELKLKAKNKGDVVREELQASNAAYVLVLGDDTTDIDMMEVAINSNKDAVVVMVGDKQVKPELSRYPKFFRLENPLQVQELLRGLADQRGCGAAPDLRGLTMSANYREANQL